MKKLEFINIVDKTTRKNINQYVELVCQNLNKNPTYARLASSIFLSSFDTIEWFKNISIQNFGNFSYKGRIFDRKICDFKTIDNIAFVFKYVKNINLDNHYTFFSKRDFETYEALKKNYTGSYYVYDKNIISKIDSVFFEVLEDFKKEGKKSPIYSKQFGDKVYLKFARHKSQKDSASIDQYYFPDMYLEINKQQYSFTTGTDLSTFLLHTGNSFLAFYMNSNEFEIDAKGNILQVLRKKDEPVIYEFENLKKYSVTNSVENLVRYNRFIYYTIELFVHFLRVFEKWLTDILLPELLPLLLVKPEEIK